MSVSRPACGVIEVVEERYGSVGWWRMVTVWPVSGSASRRLKLLARMSIPGAGPDGGERGAGGDDDSRSHAFCVAAAVLVVRNSH